MQLLRAAIRNSNKKANGWFSEISPLRNEMMRIAKKIAFFILCLFLLLYTLTWVYYRFFNAVNQDNSTASIKAVNKITTLNWIPIHWVSGTLSDREAMYLPVYVDTIKKPFWMQFDLGTAVTDFYDITPDFPALSKREILLNYKTIYQNNPRFYSNFNLKLGDSAIYYAVQIPLYDKLTADSIQINDTMYNTKIGNLGYDLIKDRILILDYKNSRIALTDSLPQTIIGNIKYFDGAITKQKPIYLPIKIDGNEKLMQFDNGSSAFTFWTSIKQWEDWRKQEVKTDTFLGSAWQNAVFYYKSYPNVKIEFLEKDVSLQPIWAVSNTESATPLNFLQKIKKITDAEFGKTTAGFIGNEYFRNDIIIIDAKHNKFGRLKN